MMTPKDVRAIITAAGLPVAYRAWQENSAPALPFCVYYAGRANNFAADGVVYHTAQRYTIELYTEDKALEVEAKIEAALTGAGIYWSKDETYIVSERMNEIIYEIEV